MYNSSIKLLDAKDIALWPLTRLIAEMSHPNPEKLTGIDCIRGIYKSTDIGPFPFTLNPSERDYLVFKLPELPPLRYKMSIVEQTAFYFAYCALPDRPAGDLYLISPFESSLYWIAVEQTQIEHKKHLVEKIKSGELNAYSFDHIPSKTGEGQVFISRTDAIRYLSSINLLDPAQNDSLTQCIQIENFEDTRKSIQYRKQISPTSDIANKQTLKINVSCDDNGIYTDKESGDDTRLQASLTSSHDSKQELFTTNASRQLSSINVTTNVSSHEFDAVNRVHKSRNQRPYLDEELENEIPFFPKNVKAAGKLVIKAAWLIQQETGYSANAQAVFEKLIEWYFEAKEKKIPGFLFSDYKESEDVFVWKTKAFQGGRDYKLHHCELVLKKWHADCKKNAKK